MSRLLHRLTCALIIALLMLSYLPGPLSVSAQTPGQDPLQQLVEMLPTRVKVGQLVMVSFPGVEVGEDSEIAALISDYAIGGVWLRPENGNFSSPGSEPEAGVTSIAPAELISITNQLQGLSWRLSRTITPPLSDFPLYQGSSLPLFVAVEPETQNLPITRFISGTSLLPSAMSLGATWNRALVEAAGQVAGRELTALGFNLLLGPNLDVLDAPRPGEAADLGTAAFGGDGYWVGELGRAYVRGIHQGSLGRMAVIPRHFPGLGNADRPLSEELPTIQRSLEQLQRVELAPFLSVTAQTPGAEVAADGLLVTHARYQGFQGTIRQSTRPLSLDSQGLQVAMTQFGAWRQSGGLLVADNLGLPALRRFYDPRELTFNARQVARDALLAGNDLLILDRFAATEDWDEHFANVRTTLDFLAQLYESDPTVKARIDEAVTRVLQLKLRLNPTLSLTAALRDVAAPDAVLGQGTTVNAQIAVNGITRLAPLADDLLPPAPAEDARLVIFVQERAVTLAPDGPTVATLPRELVSRTLLRLYGPEGTGQVRPDHVTIYSFEELARFLETPDLPPEDSAAAISADLPRAQWVIFATTGFSLADPESLVLKSFLEQQAALLESRLVVLNFGPPYDLDSTDVSKLDLYYTLYFPSEAFVQTAFQALFRDLPASAASPVSVPAVNYVLSLQLSPNPAQTIALNVVDSKGQEMATEEIRDIRKGDVIYLRTSVIYDRNGHAVPDRTPVQFTLTYPQEDRTRIIAAETKDGVAFTSITLDQVGQLDITVESRPAQPLFHLQLTIREESVIMISITPTPPPPDMTPTPTQEAVSVVIKPLPEPLYFPSPQRGFLLAWGLMGGLVCAVTGFWWGRERVGGLVEALRLALWGGIGGLGVYVLFASLYRWPWRTHFYALAGREFLAGIVALCGGGGVLLIVHALSHRRQ
ncbi:MAG TPA: glycoside hydrolase family 3 N-terminal domain-containing protein [Anaerolineae bacterium]|nr:glycoside hydrolase family 3 N-terminal domain-containing protein [Anaerolineae bacterium]